MWGSAVQVCSGLPYGGLAQLARAPALQAGGQRFESVILHIGVWYVAMPSQPSSRAIFDILKAKAKCKANLRVIYYIMYDVVKDKKLKV